MHYMYSQKLVIAQLNEDIDKASDIAKEEDMALAELWVLAEKIIMPHLQNLALASMHKIWSKRTTRDLMRRHLD